MYDPDLVTYVAAAMRKADGDHTMGTGNLAEVVVDAVLRYQDNHRNEIRRAMFGGLE